MQHCLHKNPGETVWVNRELLSHIPCNQGMQGKSPHSPVSLTEFCWGTQQHRPPLLICFVLPPFLSPFYLLQKIRQRGNGGAVSPSLGTAGVGSHMKTLPVCLRTELKFEPWSRLVPFLLSNHCMMPSVSASSFFFPSQKANLYFLLWNI